MGFGNNICVVGAGQWGKNHIRTLDKLDALKGIVEPDLDVLHKFLNKYPDVSGHTDRFWCGSDQRCPPIQLGGRKSGKNCWGSGQKGELDKIGVILW